MDKPPDPPVVFLDACVLYPNLVREVVLRLAGAGLLRPAWSPRVLAEWRIAAARDGGRAAESAADAVAARMAATFPGAGVTPDPALEQTLHLPDPADVHVLAGAIAAGAGVLLTFNMRDFPARRLAAHGIAPRHPDGFLWELFSKEPKIAGQAIRETAAGAGRTDVDAIRRALKRARLSRLAKAWFASESGGSV
ncbi:MAG: RSP_2648 family PIN domain-containing protein [Alphaproteobacteria bacterium]